MALRNTMRPALKHTFITKLRYLSTIGRKVPSFNHQLVTSRFASSSSHEDPHKVGSGAKRGVHAEGYHDPSEELIERQPDDYRPGSDTYAYENPWPKLNKGRLDWLFDDSWRRPLAKDQGQKLRREWVPFGWDIHDEHNDWRTQHWWAFGFGTILFAITMTYLVVAQPDFPQARGWCKREAFLELERRRQAGLSPISKDYLPAERVLATLPSDEELGDFEIII